MGQLGITPNVERIAVLRELAAENQEALRARNQKLRAMWAPPPDLSISDWAEANLVLRKGTSVRPGPWRTESYQRGIFDALRNPQVREVSLRKSTQVGWSAMLNAITGYFIDPDPSPIMFVQPSKMAAEEYSKKRMAPLIADCPALAAKIKPANARKSGNTLLLKEFDGGFLRFASAGAAKTLRSDQIRVLICDEVDGYDDDVEGEGPPIEVARRRTDSYEDAKILIGGTPAKPKGLSNSDNAFQRSDQRYYWVPCPHCGFMQPMVWRDQGEFLPPADVQKYAGIFGTGLYRLRWDKDARGAPVPGSIRYHCAQCEKGIDEKHKQQMLDAGEWRARFPGVRDLEGYFLAGFAINALYSPWKNTVWSGLAQEWHEAQDNPEALKTFVNLRLGEPWNEGRNDEIDADTLLARREPYPRLEAPTDAPAHWQDYLVPRQCCVLAATADIQTAGGGRIEAQITGFGPGEESWLIAHEVFWGDPSVRVDPETGMDVWGELDRFLLREWRHECGAVMRPAITLVDSGDCTDAVYEFVLPRQFAARRVYACKGVKYLTKPVLVQEGTAKRHAVRLWAVSTDAAKDRILARLRIPRPGLDQHGNPLQFHHLPEWATEEYCSQLTSEQKMTTRDRRTRKLRREYVSTHSRNEALDLTVYAHGALFVLQNFIDPMFYRDLARIQAELAKGQLAQPITPGRRVRSHGLS